MTAARRWPQPLGMSRPDAPDATIRRLRAELQRALEDVADLHARLDYAEGQIRALRARVRDSINQAALPQ